jgi:hypothetical protein
MELTRTEKPQARSRPCCLATSVRSYEESDCTARSIYTLTRWLAEDDQAHVSRYYYPFRNYLHLGVTGRNC